MTLSQLSLVSACCISLSAAPSGSPTSASYGKLPLLFEQSPGGAFIARGRGYLMSFGPNHTAFQFKNESVRMDWTGCAAHPKITGVRPSETKTNYFLGNDPAKWRTGVQNYGAIQYQSVCPGVDLLFYGNQRELEYDVILQPGADASKLRFNLHGFKRIHLNKTGDLILSTPSGDLIERKPIVYEESQGHHRPIEARYILYSATQFGFALGPHSKTSRVVIDPVLTYSTFLGGTGNEGVGAITVDAGRNAYITGYTLSADFPVSHPVQAMKNAGLDAFVAKINPAGTALVYATYLGGTTGSRGGAIVVDSSGNAYVTGSTTSSDFPITPGAPQSQGCSAIIDCVFVSKLDPSGSTLLFSTYLGGQIGNNYAAAIGIDASRNVFVAGRADAFRTTAGAYQTRGQLSGFLAKLNPSGTTILFSTLLGGVGYPNQYSAISSGITALAIDANGFPYLAGSTNDGQFETTPGALQENIRPSFYGDGHTHAFVMKFRADGSGLVYSTLLGGSTDEYAGGLVVDSLGNAYVAGHTSSNDFPVTVALSTSHPDMFVSKLNPAGSALVFSVPFGYGDPHGIALDSSQNIVIAGDTDRLDFPLTSGALQIQPGNGGGGFVSKLSASGTGLIYSTYLGAGSQTRALALDASGSAYIAGNATAAFPATSGALQKVVGGSTDAFIAKISEGTCNTSIHLDAATFGVNGGSLTFAVSADPACNWVAVSSSNFAKVLSGASGIGNGSVTLNAPVNPAQPRSALFSIAGHTFTLSQSGTCFIPVVYTPRPPLASGGAAGSFTVSPAPNCALDIRSSAPWLEARVSGLTAVDLMATPNTDLSPRSATVAVAGQNFTILQPGGYVCSYSLPSAMLSFSSLGGLATAPVTTASGCDWMASSNDSWLKILGASPSGVNFQVAPNSGPARTGTLTIAGQTFTVTQSTREEVSVTSVTPPAAFGAAAQRYTFQFTDTLGSQNLGILNVLINSALDRRAACYLGYSTQLNVLYLVDDSGLNLLPGLKLDGSPGLAENSQCTVYAIGSSATGSGNTLTLSLNLTFKSAFAGNKLVYAAARNLDSLNTGWQIMGVHGVPPLPNSFPSVSVLPSALSGATQQATFTFQDANNANNLQTMWALINNSLDGRGACYIAYYRPGNQVFLIPDNGDGSQATSMVLTGTNTVGNSQCTVSAQGSSVTVNGAQVSISLPVTLKPGFQGRKAIWMAGSTLDGAHSAWQVQGTWNTP